MTPQEKAKELVDKYLTMENTLNIIDLPYLEMSKQCALIAVNELIKSAPSLIEIERIEHIKYWVNVGEEIEKL
jgi:hypothetical protein